MHYAIDAAAGYGVLALGLHLRSAAHRLRAARSTLKQIKTHTAHKAPTSSQQAARSVYTIPTERPHP